MSSRRKEKKLIYKILCSKPDIKLTVIDYLRYDEDIKNYFVITEP